MTVFTTNPARTVGFGGRYRGSDRSGWSIGMAQADQLLVDFLPFGEKFVDGLLY